MTTVEGDLGAGQGADMEQASILHVDMDSFFASVEVQERPELRGLPVIVGGSGARGVVTAATYEARAFGIRAGMPIGRARSACPHGVYLPSRHDLYREYSKLVMNVLREITPAVEQISIDEAFLDATGARLRIGTPVEVAELVRRRLREEVGLPASVGIASTKSVAKIASARAKPDGLLLVRHEETLDFLHPLPIGALWGVGRKTEEILRVRGIETIGDLAHHPLSELQSWLGVGQAGGLHDLAWGRDDRAVGPRQREKSISTERTFQTNVTSLDQLHAFLIGASHDCARRLRHADLKAWTVVMKLRDGNFETITRSRTLLAPTDVGREIAQAAVALAESVRFPRGGVRLAGVGVSSLVSQDEGVPTLLDDDPRPRATELVMDAAHTRFGANALRPASLLDEPDHRPAGESHSGPRPWGK